MGGTVPGAIANDQHIVAVYSDLCRKCANHTNALTGQAPAIGVSWRTWRRRQRVLAKHPRWRSRPASERSLPLSNSSVVHCRLPATLHVLLRSRPSSSTRCPSRPWSRWLCGGSLHCPPRSRLRPLRVSAVVGAALRWHAKKSHRSTTGGSVYRVERKRKNGTVKIMWAAAYSFLDADHRRQVVREYAPDHEGAKAKLDEIKSRPEVKERLPKVDGSVAKLIDDWLCNEVAANLRPRPLPRPIARLFANSSSRMPSVKFRSQKCARLTLMICTANSLETACRRVRAARSTICSRVSSRSRLKSDGSFRTRCLVSSAPRTTRPRSRR